MTAADPAAGDPALVDAAWVAAIVASVAGQAVLAGAALPGACARRWHARNRQAISRHTPIVLRAPQATSAPRRAAIEAPRPSFADIRALAAWHGYDMIRLPEEDPEG